MKKIINILLLVIIFCLIGTISVYAAEGVTLEGDSTAKAGETKTLEVRIKADEDMGGIQFNLEYSDNIEEIKEANVSGENQWTGLYAESEKLVTAYTGRDGQKDVVVVKISYKLKANATGNATIKIKNIKLTSTILEEINVSEPVTKTIQITGDTPNPPIQEPTTKTLSSISITTKPNKVSYTEGESFDKTGMVITASYSDGTSAVVNNYTYTPNSKLKVSDNKMTITYTEGNVTKTAIQDISVKAASADKGNVETDKKGNVTQKDSTTANKQISKTGISDTIYIVIAAVLVIGIVSYIKYKKYKEI